MAENKEISQARDVIKVDNELLENISVLIDSKDEKSLLNIFADIHTADIAEIINHLEVDEATFAFELLPNDIAGEVVTEIDENLREKILSEIDTKKIANIVDELETDDATDIVSDLPDNVAEQVLRHIDKEYSDDVKELLKYEEDTAGGIMNSDFVYVSESATVQDAIEQVRKHADEYEHIYHIYVLKETDELVGYVILKSLLINPLDTKITSIVEEDIFYVKPDTDQEEVANLMEKYDLVVIPVVDEHKRMLGRITIDDVVDVIHEEASEDIQKLAGLSEEQESTDSIFRISRIRLPWLIIALLLELFNAMVLASYEHLFQRLVLATFFIPVVMAVGGNSGTQAAIVMVRGLSIGDIWIDETFRKIGKEFFVSLVNGLVCSAVLMGASMLFFDTVSFKFAIIISSALFGIIIFATVVGAAIPVILKKFGVDPAIATGPFVTTTNDIVGIVIYLSIITYFFP
ncbi:MAG: magnesium transporter [Ignavibacteria bacterium GWB2_35_6b]|nr:MAG: magnesium transporter [Ignavibacteria bacterium GWB2_35_6b]